MPLDSRVWPREAAPSPCPSVDQKESALEESDAPPPAIFDRQFGRAVCAGSAARSLGDASACGRHPPFYTWRTNVQVFADTRLPYSSELRRFYLRIIKLSSVSRGVPCTFAYYFAASPPPAKILVRFLAISFNYFTAFFVLSPRGVTRTATENWPNFGVVCFVIVFASLAERFGSSEALAQTHFSISDPEFSSPACVRACASVCAL